MSSDNPSTESQPFLPEWVTEVFYGGQWHQILLGSFRRTRTDYGVVYTYEDPYSRESVYVATDIEGYKFRKPELSANVIQLNSDK